MSENNLRKIYHSTVHAAWMLEAPAYPNLFVTYPTYREQLITEVCQKLLFLRIKHVWWLEPSLGDQRAVHARRTLRIIITIPMDDSVVDGVDAWHFVGGIITFADRHHFVFITILFFEFHSVTVFVLGELSRLSQLLLINNKAIQNSLTILLAFCKHYSLQKV